MQRLSRETPVTFEISLAAMAASRGRSGFRSLLWGAIAGAIGGSVGAVAMGSTYVLAHADEDAEWSRLAPQFLALMIGGGLVIGVVVRLGLVIFDRRPVLSAAMFGALGCMIPGAIAARAFGMQPLPFVGEVGFALAVMPLTMSLAFASARDGESGVLRPALVGSSVTLLVAAIVAVFGALIDGPPLLEVLRAFLFLGIDKVGTLVGAIVGLCVGLCVGLSVHLARRLSGNTRTSVIVRR